jgi:hypothetical protein
MVRPRTNENRAHEGPGFDDFVDIAQVPRTCGVWSPTWRLSSSLGT